MPECPLLTIRNERKSRRHRDESMSVQGEREIRVDSFSLKKGEGEKKGDLVVTFVRVRVTHLLANVFKKTNKMKKANLHVKV